MIYLTYSQEIAKIDLVWPGFALSDLKSFQTSKWGLSSVLMILIIEFDLLYLLLCVLLVMWKLSVLSFLNVLWVVYDNRFKYAPSRKGLHGVKPI